jgi:ATP-dependent DNA helicase RecQ
MSGEQFGAVQAVLRMEVVDGEKLSGPHRRFVDAWQDSGSCGPADLAALLNQVLRHENLTSGFSARVDLPIRDGGPTGECLERAGLNVTSLGADHLRVTTGSRWSPTWLRGDNAWIDLAISSPEGMSDADGIWIPSFSRPERPVEIDPAVEQLSHVATYRSNTQAVALRTVALAPPGSTVHVVLPTGSGKSLVGLAPGLLRPGTTTVVIVPTIALALDQERQAQLRFPEADFPEELAYYGDLDPERKALIRRRLGEGQQRLIFTSPEALVHGLALSLHQLARRGGLRYVVVDEAHLVRTWGLDFRPEFQLAAALVAELKQVSRAAGQPPPTTVLMTATLSRDGLRLNETLFGGEPSIFVGSTFLRTELRYLQGACSTEEERMDRLIEAMHRIPRPAIVYTTRKNAAEQIVARMRDAGFGRVRAFHGDIDGPERLEILRGWSGDGQPTSIDIVVGTSAFGLGVDQADVRAVVHACVPGSVDRYYQEVGRAGRDGHAAIALWMPVRGSDLREASRIEGATVIGDAKAWARWEAMRSSGVQIGDRLARMIAVNTSVVPLHIAVQSDANRLWNRNTLTLLARAGAIEVVALAPPSLTQDADESEIDWLVRYEAAWTNFRDSVAFRLAPDIGNLDQTAFERAITRVRSEVLSSQQGSLARVARLLDMEQCFADVFAEEYYFRQDRNARTAAVQYVSASCSGCPATQHHGPEGGQAPIPIIPRPSMPVLDLELQPALTAEMHGQGGLVVTYEASGRRSGPEPWLDELVRRCIANGVRALVIPEQLRNHPAVQRAHRHSREGLVVVDSAVGGPRAFAVPTLVVVYPGDSVPRNWLPPATHGPPRVVFMHVETPDPEKPGVRVADWRSPVLPINELLRRI